MKAKLIKISTSCILVSLAIANAHAATPISDQGSVQAALDGVRLGGTYGSSAPLSSFYQNDNMGTQWTSEMAIRVAELSGKAANTSGDVVRSPFIIAQRDIQTSMQAIEIINKAKSQTYPQLNATASDLYNFKHALVNNLEEEFLQELSTDNLLLRRLQAVEQQYSLIVQAGDWPVLTSVKLELGDRGSAVSILKARLLSEGYKPGNGDKFDSDLKRALRQYQGIQGLKASGVLDKATRQSLLVPAWRRLQTIRANIARFEQQERLQTDSNIIVNIPAFKGEYFSSGTPVWSDRVIVGRTDRRTPEISSKIERVVFNPSWYVPNKLVYRDILPRASRDPGYWERMGYLAYGADGKIRDVEAGSSMTDVFTEDKLRIRQPPGPRNALGQVKFLFPNQHAVYLHDTPNRKLFGRDIRAFSSGCVRVNDPLRLAEVLFQNQVDTADESLLERSVDQLIAARKTRSVPLEKSVSVNTIYLTAEPTLAGKVRFHEDIYSYDTAEMASKAISLLTQG